MNTRSLAHLPSRMLSRLLLCVAVAFGFSPLFAQDDIQFRPVPSSQKNLTEDASRTLETKVLQILGRCSAAAGAKADPGSQQLSDSLCSESPVVRDFIVEPALTLGSEESTSGLVRNVNLVSGELTLTAKNAADNAIFYAVTVPLKATSRNTGEDPMLLLAKSIKITEPVYVRFVRNARKNIQKYLQSREKPQTEPQTDPDNAGAK